METPTRLLATFMFFLLSAGVCAFATPAIAQTGPAFHARPSVFVVPHPLLIEECKTRRIFSLCGPGLRRIQSVRCPWLTVGSRSAVGRESVVFQLVSLFIDSMDVASFGDWRMALRVEIR